MIFTGTIGAFQLILIIATILILLATAIALIDILRSEFKGNNKIVWILVVLFTSILGLILYFVMGRNQKIS